MQGTNFWPALLMQLNPTASHSVGIGVYNSIIAAFTAGLAAVCCGVCLWQRRLAQRDTSNTQQVQMQQQLESDAAAAAAASV